MKLYAFSRPKWFASVFSTFAVMGLFLFSSPGVWAVFSDVSYTGKGYVAIETLTEKNIFKGLNDNNFGPNQALNRAEAVTLMLRYGGYTVSEESISTSSFPDVDPKLWYAGSVEQGVDLGIVKGNEDGTFAPAQQVESAEFLMMLVRTDKIDLSSFSSTVEPWYAPVMAYAKTRDIYPYSDPAKVLTREEAAHILYLSLLLREAENNTFLSQQAQTHLSHIESSVTANQLTIAMYHAQLALDLALNVLKNLPNDSSSAAQERIAQSYLAWVESISAALKGSNDLALKHIQNTLQWATEAYFKDNSTQPLGAHLKDIACEVYSQLPTPKGEMPADCVARLNAGV